VSFDVTVGKKELVQLLQRCVGVAAKKTTMPVLTNVLLSAEDGTLFASTTDLYLSFVGSTTMHDGVDGDVAVPAKGLLERAKNMPAGLVRVCSRGDSVEVSAVDGKRRFNLKSIAAEDFPEVPVVGDESIVFAAATLDRLISSTKFAISQDETRAHINCAMLQVGGGVARVVATDGQRLCKTEVKIDDESSVTALLPLRSVSELHKLLSDCEPDAPVGVNVSGPVAFFSFDDFELSTKVVDAQFPPYESVIPEGDRSVVVAPKGRLVDSLKAVSVAANERTGAVRVSVKPGVLTIVSQSPDSGDGFDEVPVEYSGKSFEVGFNAAYLLDAIGAVIGDSVRLDMGGELDPTKITSTQAEDYLAVVMPMRI
jgi:DNA polymerase-3 subunit beta